VSTPDDHTPPVQFEERVIMSDMHKHLAALVNATKAYVGATSSSVRFLIAKNEQMDKELQMTKQGGEMVTSSARVELKKVILDEVFSLETVTQALYSKFGIVHKAVVHLNVWQQCCARRAHILSNFHTDVDYMQTWTMRYKGASLHLPKMMKPKAIEIKERIPSQIWNYEELSQLITSLQVSHAWVFRSMDFVVHADAIPSIGTLAKAKTKAQVRLELDLYFDKLMRIDTSADLVISVDTMHQYIIGTTKIKKMMHMLLGELDIRARAV